MGFLSTTLKKDGLTITNKRSKSGKQMVICGKEVNSAVGVDQQGWVFFFTKKRYFLMYTK
jgi:hypothetical protein